MNTSVVQVQYEELEAIARRFASQAEAGQEMRQLLKQRMEALRAGGWIGRGADAFMAEMTDVVLPAVQRLTDALHEGDTATGRIVQMLRAAEQEAASQFSVDGVTSFPSDRIINFLLDGRTRIIGSHTVQQPLFVQGKSDSGDINPNDLAQGGIGDCYLISSIAVIADQNPTLIRNAIHNNGDGTYTVTLYEEKGGFLGIGSHYEPVEITVTPNFPNGEYYSKEAGQWVSLGMDVGSGDQELWPRLIEKAYGQHISGTNNIERIYGGLDNGGLPSDALATLSGSKSTAKSPAAYSLQELAEMHQKGYALTLSSLPDDGAFTSDKYRNDTLVRSHAYWIDSIDVDRGVVVVQNPWGYDGRYRIEIPFNELDDNFRQITVNSLGKD